MLVEIVRCCCVLAFLDRWRLSHIQHAHAHDVFVFGRSFSLPIICNATAVAGQVHFFPAVCNAEQIKQEFAKRGCGKL